MYLLDTNNRHANNQLTTAELATNSIVPLPDGMGANGFIAVDFNAEEGSSSRRDSIVQDHTQHKEILRLDAPITTLG
jgi:hypothetical protein